MREKLSENRLFGTDFLTDVGDAAPTGRRKRTKPPHRTEKEGTDMDSIKNKNLSELARTLRKNMTRH